MSDITIFSEEWNREAANEERALGGIRIGRIKPLGVPTVDDKLDDEETLQREEKVLRQKLTQQLAQMKERETNGREYLRKHGITPESIVELLGALFEGLFFGWWHSDEDREKRCCFWAIIIFIVLCLLVGLILWFVFR
jgi:F0F1-type ATP synthase assembly protein I